VTVPGVIGQPVAQAEGTLSQAGLDVVVTERASQTVPAGTTLLQSPAMGTRVPRGTTVKLTISSGSAAAKPAAAPVPMPTCVAQAPGIAAPSAVPTAAPGTAVASPLPSVPGGGPSAVPTAAPGTAVPSPVATSGGPAAVPTVGEVSMPSLIGKTSLTAVHTAQVEGLTVVLKDKPAPATQSVPGGVVWGQAPAGGSGVPAGATVTLYCQP
jgi:serine/threonine-protein kinase